MALLVWMSVVLCLGTLVQCDLEDDDRNLDEYTNKYMEAFRTVNISEDSLSEDIIRTTGKSFSDCSLPFLPRPKSIHDLSPEFVDVVAAMGDSITAAFGARSGSLLTLFREFRGISWSIGGDSTIDEVMTLPNAIEHFNFGIKGFSTGVGTHRSNNAVLNVAVTGARSRDMLGQAETLVRRMDEKGIGDEQWKLITLWIGGNDLCDVRDDGRSAQSFADEYIGNVQQALDYLKANVKRAFINMVQMIDIAPLDEVDGFLCGTIHLFVCNSIQNSRTRGKVTEIVQLYNEELEQLIDNGNRYESDDFTVVLQPFFTQTELPRLQNGEADNSYFAPDCFHFSQLGHSAVATYLWNNMFEPVGRKTVAIDWDNQQDLICPWGWPYFSTYSNGVARQSALNVGGIANVNEFQRGSSLLTTASLLPVLTAALLGLCCWS